MVKAWPDHVHDAISRTLQYLADLNPHQDLWAEAGKALLNFFNTDLVAFGERHAEGNIVLRHWYHSNQDLRESLSGLMEVREGDDTDIEQVNLEIKEAIAETLEYGFPVTRVFSEPVTLSLVCLPMTDGHRIASVMLVGHHGSEPLPKERLEIYLTFAGLVGTTATRLSLEKELSKQRRQHEQVVKERTAELTKANEQLQREITERTQAQARVTHLNRVLKAINSINQIIFREKDQDRLLQSICELLIETRGYYNAWIVLWDESNRPIHSAEAGVGEEFSSLTRQLEHGNMITCARCALSQAEVVVFEDPASTCKDCPLSAGYVGRGGLSIQLAHNNKVYGLITVSIPVQLCPDPQEHTLLKNLASDIAFALHDLELEAQQRHSEERLQKSEEQFKLLADHTPDVFWMSTPGIEKMLYVSPAYETVWGRSRESLYAAPTSFVEAVHPEDRERVAMEIKEHARGQWSIDYRIVTPGGEERNIQDRGTVVLDDNGRFVCMCGVARDVTMLKRVEETLCRYEHIVSCSTDMLALLDMNFIYLATNDAYAQAFGLTPQQIVGHSVTEVFGEQFFDNVIRPHAQECLKGKEVCYQDLLDFPKTGERFMEINYYPYASEHQEINGFVVNARDITERKKAEAERESLAKFPSENPNPVLRIAADGKVLYANEAAAGMLESWNTAMDKEVPGRWQQVVEETLKTGIGMLEEESIGDRILSFNVAPVKEAGYINLYARDITERKRAEEQASRAQEQLLEQQHKEKKNIQKELNRVRDELVRATRLAAIGQVSASIAHDLRNPLGAINNAVFLLKHYLSNPEEKLTRQLLVIDQEIRRSNDIITNLLELARDKQPNRQEVSFNQLMQEVFSETTIPDGIHCRVMSEPDPLYIYADKGQFRQVIHNVLMNVLEAMKDSGEFIVKAHQEVTRSLILFQDTGPGFSGEILDTLFEPLVTTKKTGTGLGLTICRDIVTRHGGTITANNGSEQGAIIRVTLPRH